MARRFPSSLDRFQVLMTTFALLVGVGVPVGVAFTLARVGITPWIIAPTVLLVVVALVGAYLYRPLGVQVSDRGLAVQRPIGALEIPWAQIAQVEGGASWPAKSLGVFRSGGFFGTYGVFWAPSWGRFEAWTTRRNPLVVVQQRDDKRILLSVDDLSAFLATVRSTVDGRPQAPTVSG